MAYTTINKSSDNFNANPYTGNGGTLGVDVGFQPDLTWLKCRDIAYYHRLYDVIRGVGKSLRSDTTASEETNSGEGLTAFNSDGYTVIQGSNTEYNNNNVDYASWNWKAGGTASSNTDGSTTTSVSVNQTSGFSIVSYTGTSAVATIGHGLGSIPKMIIVKNLSSGTRKWVVWHHNLSSASKYLSLNETAAEANDTATWNNTLPTSSVFSSAGSGEVNQSGDSFIAYCFAEKQGYSKFGSYTGNGNADGTFIYTGFKPAYVMIKNADAATDWYIYDNKRGGPVAGVYGNNNKYFLKANTNAAEANESFDMVSNGFKIRISNNFLNGSGNTLIYMAFAEAPLVGTNNVPATAR